MRSGVVVNKAERSLIRLLSFHFAAARWAHRAECAQFQHTVSPTVSPACILIRPIRNSSLRLNGRDMKLSFNSKASQTARAAEEERKKQFILFGQNYSKLIKGNKSE